MDIVQSFRQIDIATFPEVISLKRPLDLGLWVLDVSKRQLGIPKLDAQEIAGVVTDVVGFSMTARQLVAAFKRASGKVHCYRGTPTRYAIMLPGENHVAALREASAAGVEVLVLEAGTKHSSKRTARQVLEDLRGPLSFCDPYCGERTLDLVTGLGNGNHPVRILTRLDNLSPRKKAKLVRELSDFVTEYRYFQFRDYAQHELHDRFVLADNALVILGHSIKDLGGKDSFVVVLSRAAVPGVYACTAAMFDRKWLTAHPIA